MGLDARLVSFAFACLPVLCCFHFLLQENQMMVIFLRPEENSGGPRRPLSLPEKRPESPRYIFC